jgi:hypothetical protein
MKQRTYSLTLKVLTGGIAVWLCAGADRAAAQAPLWLGAWYPSIEAELTFDNNVNRSFDGNGERDDLFFSPLLRVEQQFPMADRTFGYVAGLLYGELYSEYSKLNFGAPGVDLGIRRQWQEDGKGPAFVAGLQMAYEFHNQDFRFGAEAKPRLQLELPAGDAFLATLTYTYDNRFASENPVYDQNGHTIGFTADMAVTEQVGIIIDYMYRRGDVLVHQPRDDLGAEIRGRRFPIDTFKQRYDAVKLKDEDTHTLSLNIRYDLDLYTSLRAGFVYEEIRAGGDTYPSTQLVLGLSYLL